MSALKHEPVIRPDLVEHSGDGQDREVVDEPQVDSATSGLPAPFSPSSPSISPLSTVKFIFEFALTGPKLLLISFNFNFTDLFRPSFFIKFIYSLR